MQSNRASPSVPHKDYVGYARPPGEARDGARVAAKEQREHSPERRPTAGRNSLHTELRRQQPMSELLIQKEGRAGGEMRNGISINQFLDSRAASPLTQNVAFITHVLLVPATNKLDAQSKKSTENHGQL